MHHFGFLVESQLKTFSFRTHLQDSPLSSKVAMFNNQANQHQQSQLLNPFSHDGRASSPKPTFSKDQYGKPLAGSLTEMRGQKANMHVMKEMLELCQIIDSEGYVVKDEPTMRVIPFGELFNVSGFHFPLTCSPLTDIIFSRFTTTFRTRLSASSCVPVNTSC